MRTYLLPQNGRFYKANLHCHSTVSDGQLTPEGLKDLYKGAGYSVLAYSDHNMLVDHSDLNDENFLALTSTEINLMKDGDEHKVYRPVYHFNLFAEDPHNTTLPCFNIKYLLSKGLQDIKHLQQFSGDGNYERDYEKVNEMVAEFQKNGFLVMLNHPTWSLQTMEDYDKLEFGRFFAVEIYNHCSYSQGFDEINTHIYDELLRRGHRIFCTATDDNHNSAKRPPELRCFESLGGFVMIKAEELSYGAILNALKRGDFYASNGPEIHELYIEDNTLTVRTSPAVRIALTTGHRQAKVVMPKWNETVTEASFNLEKLREGYLRITVTDEEGKQAWSQPVFGTFGIPKEL